MTQRIEPRHIIAAQNVLAAAAAAAGAGQACAPGSTRILKGLPNYSRVRFVGTRGGGGPWTYAVDVGQERIAFGYGLGQEMSGPSGFPSPTTATRADTNIKQAGRTNAGENLEVRGISIACVGIGGVSDALLALQLMPELVASLQFEGGEWELGPCEMMPGGSAMYGAAISPGAGGTSVGAMSAGLPVGVAFFPIAGGFKWTAQGTDSTLNVKIKPARALLFTSPAAAAPPATINLDLRVQLHGVTLQEPSQNQ